MWIFPLLVLEILFLSLSRAFFSPSSSCCHSFLRFSFFFPRFCSFSIDPTTHITILFLPRSLSLSPSFSLSLSRKHSLTQLSSTHIVRQFSVSYAGIQAHLTLWTNKRRIYPKKKHTPISIYKTTDVRVFSFLLRDSVRPIIWANHINPTLLFSFLRRCYLPLIHKRYLSLLIKSLIVNEQ